MVQILNGIIIRVHFIVFHWLTTAISHLMPDAACHMLLALPDNVLPSPKPLFNILAEHCLPLHMPSSTLSRLPVEGVEEGGAVDTSGQR